MFASLKSMLYEDTAPVASQPKAQATGGEPSISQGAGVNQDMVSAIKRVTFGRNTAYTQLLNASEQLADVIPDQVMRLKAAHKTAGGGRTGKQIAEAVDVHLQDVDGEVMRFKAAVDQKAATEISSIESQAAIATQRVTAAQQEIQSAQQRIVDLNASIVKLSQEANDASQIVAQKRADLEVATSQFNIAANAVRQELQTSKSAILSTLV